MSTLFPRQIPLSIKLIGLIIIVPLIEMLLLYLASWILGGWFWPIVLMFGSGMLGGFIARWQGLRCWKELNSRLDKNEVPTETILHGVMIFFAGLFLVVPGFLSDIAGLLLLLPFCRSAAIASVIRQFQDYREKHRFPQGGGSGGNAAGGNNTNDDDVIDIGQVSPTGRTVK